MTILNLQFPSLLGNDITDPELHNAVERRLLFFGKAG